MFICVALPESTGIAVILEGFHFLRKGNVVGTVGENNSGYFSGYLMDNDAIFILSTVEAIVRKCIVLLFSTTVTILYSCCYRHLLPDGFYHFSQNHQHQKG